MTVNKVFEQSLSVILCIALKEVSNLHQTATISTLRNKSITDVRFEIKRLTERSIDNFITFSIQKSGCRNYHFHLPFKSLQTAGNPCKVIRKITDEDKRKLFKDEEIYNEAWEIICKQAEN